MTTENGPLRRDLAAFLRSRREALDPVALGFGYSSRRRTPGLRREEVAILSGVSATWYTWLEQEREITISRHVIDSLATALQLGTVERRHLFTLAGMAPPVEHHERPAMAVASRRLLETLEPNPACLNSPFFDLLAWNHAYERLVGGFDGVGEDELNAVWLLFTQPWRREPLREWDRESRNLIGQLRTGIAQHPDDPRGAALVDGLTEASTEFRKQWADHQVRAFQPSPVHFDHAEAGLLRLETMKFAAAEDGWQNLTVFLAADEETLSRLRHL